MAACRRLPGDNPGDEPYAARYTGPMNLRASLLLLTCTACGATTHGQAAPALNVAPMPALAAHYGGSFAQQVRRQFISAGPWLRSDDTCEADVRLVVHEAGQVGFSPDAGAAVAAIEATVALTLRCPDDASRSSEGRSSALAPAADGDAGRRRAVEDAAQRAIHQAVRALIPPEDR